MTIVYIAIAGTIGTLARFLISQLIIKYTNANFPWATLTVNLVGCFLIGVAYQISINQNWPMSLKWILFGGFLAAFTTFSAFGLETIQLIEKNQIQSAVTYILTSNIGGVLLVWLAMKLSSQ